MSSLVQMQQQQRSYMPAWMLVVLRKYFRKQQGLQHKPPKQDHCLRPFEPFSRTLW